MSAQCSGHHHTGPDTSPLLPSPPLPALPATNTNNTNCPARRHQHRASSCIDRHFVLTRRDCVVGRCPGLLRVLWDCGAILLSPLSTPAVAVLLWSRASTVSSALYRHRHCSLYNRNILSFYFSEINNTHHTLPPSLPPSPNLISILGKKVTAFTLYGLT